MQPSLLNLVVDKSGNDPVYVQIANQLIIQIREGNLHAGQQLPSTRQLAESLQVHRKTVVRAYDELTAQGWLESRSGSGTFAATHLPEVKPEKLDTQQRLTNPAQSAGFDFSTSPHLEIGFKKDKCTYHLDDGFPDPRIAPLADLSRAYRSQLLIGDRYSKLGYTDPQGSLWLREELATYLTETRGLNVTADNILITRGTVMGVYLTATGLIQPGDQVITGETGWTTAEAAFIQSGAKITRLPVDGYGIQVDELERICQKSPVRLVYVTSHHHYPTTVALRADRRMQLLRLAEKYRFIIFEDDYDYDFHYDNKPLLPLASADKSGMVLYCGSFTKTISPAFRVGYLIGSADVISHLTQLRRIIDRQGDTMLENAIAELLQNGIIQRHLRKSLRIYKQRRDLFCSLMKDQLSDYTSFDIPDGGMAVWTNFDPRINLFELAQKALKRDLYFAGGVSHASHSVPWNATRLGFASSSEKELIQSVEILSDLIKNDYIFVK
jgi:GntR family transcriptional regulator/MocR family aminotransferase